MYCLDTLILAGNPIVNSAASLAKIENDSTQVKKALDKYFNNSGSSYLGSMSNKSDNSGTAATNFSSVGGGGY